MSSHTAARGGIRAHIAMVGATTPSHVHPSLGLIRELCARGHRVTYVVGERLAPLVRPTGAEVIACTTRLPAEDDPAGWPRDPIEGMALFLDEGMHVLPQIMRAYGPERPELVLHDIAGLAGPVAAVRWGVPAVQLSPSIVAWEGYEEEMAGQLTAMKASLAAQLFYARFESWLTYNGVRRHPDDVLGRPDQGLVLIPRLLQPHADRVSPTFRFVGPCLDHGRLHERNGWAPPADGRKLAYVSFGTAYTGQLDLYRVCIEAFGETDWQLLLWCRVPMVAIPQAADQLENAARIWELGIGRVLPSDGIDSQALRHAVSEVASNASVASRLADLGAQLRDTGGTARAADVVEGFLEQGQ